MDQARSWSGLDESGGAATQEQPSPYRITDAAYYAIAILVGLGVGVVGTLFHLATDQAATWPALVREILPPQLFMAGMAATAAIMVVCSVFLVRAFCPEAAGSGVQEIEGAMEGLRPVRWARILPVKFVGGLLSLGSGLVVGREGPTIHMGAAVAQAGAEFFRLTERDTRGLLAAGGAAGLAAAFNAPLAAVLFVIEETRRQFPYGLRTYTAVILASAVSAIVTEGIAGVGPDMRIVAPDVPLYLLPAFAGLGAVLGVVGVIFNRALIWSLDTARSIGLRFSFYLIPAIVGAAIGILRIVRPEATLGGERLVITMVGENLPILVVAGVVCIRFVMTMTSYSAGTPGGIFAPILALATATGLLFGLGLNSVIELPQGMLVGFGIAAMGGLFSSSIRAPLVGMVLVVELTGAYALLLPAMLCCVFANIVADALGGEPIYEMLLNRTLRLAGQTPHPALRPTQLGGWDETERHT